MSYDCIAGSGIQLSQVTYFLSYPLTSFWFQIDRRFQIDRLRSVFLKVESVCFLLTAKVELLEKGTIKHPSRASLLTLTKFKYT